ncbi:MAG: hypothetical protein ABI321_24305 [Polyangia bacterium]
MRTLLLTLVFLAATSCSSGFAEFDASVQRDAGIPDEGTLLDGGIPVAAIFTITGCDSLTFDVEARPSCIAGPHRALMFVPLGPGVQAFVWTLPGGDPATSALPSPTVSWSAVGTYAVMLATGGSGGSALSSGTVKIVEGAAGAPCLAPDDCDATLGLTCLCSAEQGCPAGLSAGLCVRLCETTSCHFGEACIDLARGGTSSDVDGGVPDGGVEGGFRVHACLPSCSTSATCRTGFSCRTLPQVAVGADEHAPYSWTQACFAEVLGDVGDSCDDVDGNPDPGQCLTGRCDPLGADGLCTEACSTDDPCPDSAACVAIPVIGSRCLLRCESASDCVDPLLTCQGPGVGGLGYTLPSSEATTTTLCSPKRCTSDTDCAPAGSCVSSGGTLFCAR